MLGFPVVAPPFFEADSRTFPSFGADKLADLGVSAVAALMAPKVSMEGAEVPPWRVGWSSAASQRPGGFLGNSAGNRGRFMRYLSILQSQELQKN